mmetsp:Transcript_5481/g.23267  ORF Transcript_5481/g.23267 Transcript_5481/m.23267 type:complete len:478 (-) Transcript_5481:284-1717(-)
MNKLVSISKKLKGCALTSELDRQSRRTDGEVGRTARRLYRQSCRPILRMLRKWLAEGAIEDEYDEFFIFADSSIQNSRLWSEKYKLVRERTPSMIAPEVASAALIAGKAVDFLRACCDDREWVLQRASKMTERDFEDNRDLSNLTEAITAASSEASDRVKKLMFGKFRLVEHLESLRSYLLLMRGDFVQVITDALGEDLDKPAGMILRHNLVRVLENSMRISSGENESEIDRDRLDVRLLEASKKDTGWDIFRLDYRFTEAALENFFSDRVMNRYMRIFAFLWELKRAEHYLRNLWEVQRSWNASLNSSSDQLFLQCAFLRVKMNHFILNLQYFLVYEVLDSSWKTFMEELKSASDLQVLLGSHANYLNSITTRALLREESRDQHERILRILDTILDLKELQDQIYKPGAGFENRTRAGGMMDTQSALGKLEKEFDSSMAGLLESLNERTNDDNLILLALRLDFNEHYSVVGRERFL